MAQKGADKPRMRVFYICTPRGRIVERHSCFAVAQLRIQLYWYYSERNYRVIPEEFYFDWFPKKKKVLI